MARSRPQSAGPSIRRSRDESAAPVEWGALRQQQLTKLSQNKCAPKWSFGGRRGGETLRACTPGPGSYGEAGRSARAPAFGFGTTARDCSGRPSTAPGPGQYQPQVRPRSAVPQYRFATSTRGELGRGDTPGPGAYAPSVGAVKSNAPVYTAAGRRDDRQQDSTPGPGAYQAAGRLDTHQSKAPAWGFGTSGRDAGNADLTPGPGSYSAGASQEGPAYSIRWRHGGDGLGGGGDTPGSGAGSHGGLYTQFGY
mmetsp:Transcript_43261/g.122302  ORF Transcript_43261/g.122302 Transcript_43261/m.122302 type:complete len:252 (+) Transcript_43261:79-834(+)